MTAMNDFLRQRLVRRDLSGQPRDEGGRFAGTEEPEAFRGGLDQGPRGSAPPKKSTMNEMFAQLLKREN
jgi:hypothetical protein